MFNFPDLRDLTDGVIRSRLLWVVHTRSIGSDAREEIVGKIVNIRKKLGVIGKHAKNKLNQDSRGNKAALTGVVTLFVRGISMGTGLLSIPITAQYLGKEQFGIWLLLSTFMGWIALADLGLTNSLINMLATSIANNDETAAKKQVASAFFPMIFLGTFLLITSIFSSLFIPWEEVLNIRSSSFQQDTRVAIAVAMSSLQ